MIDRVLAVGLEVERLRMPGFFHFYHSKVGMWDNNAQHKYSLQHLKRGKRYGTLACYILSISIRFLILHTDYTSLFYSDKPKTHFSPALASEQYLDIIMSRGIHVSFYIQAICITYIRPHESPWKTTNGVILLQPPEFLSRKKSEDSDRFSKLTPSGS